MPGVQLGTAPWQCLTCSPREQPPPALAWQCSRGEPGRLERAHLRLYARGRYGEDKAGGTRATGERSPARHGIAVLFDNAAKHLV